MPVISHTSAAFRAKLDSLPTRVQLAAKKQYALWIVDPLHPSVNFKLLKGAIWSARVTDNYRALCVREKGVALWFWIGTHSEYDRIVRES